MNFRLNLSIPMNFRLNLKNRSTKAQLARLQQWWIVYLVFFLIEFSCADLWCSWWISSRRYRSSAQWRNGGVKWRVMEVVCPLWKEWKGGFTACSTESSHRPFPISDSFGPWAQLDVIKAKVRHVTSFTYNPEAFYFWRKSWIFSRTYFVFNCFEFY